MNSAAYARYSKVNAKNEESINKDMIFYQLRFIKIKTFQQYLDKTTKRYA